ncbi:hypothetical protein RLEG3_10950 [Rhizobium leguminosarum bv. trifolii WSM1689]|nr:hypothetical protein RLEG3_10950 [Rhizobium leguminosarum bv. trifolii WSM1689]
MGYSIFTSTYRETKSFDHANILFVWFFFWKEPMFI